MTERESLIKSIQLWQLLEKTGKTKSIAFSEFEWLEDCRYDCPLCEFVYQFPNKDDCTNCPLYSNWGSDKTDVHECLSNNSIYRAWIVAYDEESKKHYAGLLVERLQEVLITFDKENPNANIQTK